MKIRWTTAAVMFLFVLFSISLSAFGDGEGLSCRMGRSVYPVGAEYLDLTIEKKGGGIAYYDVPGTIDVLRTDGSEEWDSVAGAYAYCGGDQFEVWDALEKTGIKELRGYMGGSVRLVLPLKEIAPLAPGEYRLCWSDSDPEGERFIRFTVSEGAEALPPPESIQDERASLPPVVEEPAHADPKAYESCLDNTCWDRNSRFLKGGAVFEWRGIFKNEGNWFLDEWYLFTYPAGRPEEARLLNGGISADIRQIFDTGSGWLIRDWSDGILTAGYDGGDLTEAGTPFGGGGSLDIFEGKVPERMLIAGGRIWYTRWDGVWYADLRDLEPIQAYAADLKDTLYDLKGSEGDVWSVWRNTRDADVTMISTNGVLYFAHHGIMALDMETLECRRVTDRLNNDAGSAGYCFFMMDGRLYASLDPDEGTVSMAPDGTDVRRVSDDVFYVCQIRGGTVLAGRGIIKGFSNGYESMAFYYPDDPAHPVFDPDRCSACYLKESEYDFLLGDWQCHSEDDGDTTVWIALDPSDPRLPDPAGAGLQN